MRFKLKEVKKLDDAEKIKKLSLERQVFIDLDDAIWTIQMYVKNKYKLSEKKSISLCNKLIRKKFRIEK